MFMKKIYKILFCKCDNSNYLEALTRLADIKEKLRENPKSFMYKEIQIKIDF